MNNLDINNTLDPSYNKILKEIYENGINSDDRTGVGTKSLFCKQLRCNLKEGFPILTFRQHSFKIAFYETMMFLNGETDTIKWLESNNINIWKGNTSREFLDKRGLINLPIGDIGYAYGKIWNDFDGTNQLENIFNTLKTNPNDRRMVLTAWHPARLNEAALPPCFTKNAIIATNNGYKKIENVLSTDLILTHDGSYQKINKAYISNYNKELYELKTYYLPKIECTPNHPFMIKSYNDIINNKVDFNNEKDYINIENIKDIKDKYIPIKINNNNNIPEFSYEQKINKTLKKTNTLKLDNLDLWYLLGYFLGDGYTIESNKKTFFCIANKDVKKVLPILQNVTKLYPIKNSGVNVTKFECKNNFIFNITKQFGKYSTGKLIPEFVHDLPVEYLEYFLKGYIDSDGCENNKKIQFTTVSDSIAYGIQRIYAKLGKICSITYSIKNTTRLIQNRLCNQNNTYLLTINKSYNRQDNNYIFFNNYLWVKLKKISIINNNKDIKVYNFDIDNNHTYTINNLITHNCHIFAQFYCKNNTLSCMFNMRSLDFWNGTGYDLMCYALITYLFAKALNMDVGELVMNSTDTHLYNNGIDVYKKYIDNYQYFDLPQINIKKNINSLNDIKNIKFEDIELLNYNNAGKSENVKMAI